MAVVVAAQRPAVLAAQVVPGAVGAVGAEVDAEQVPWVGMVV